MKKNSLVTKRLTIRPLLPDDNKDWLEMFNSDLVGKFLMKLNDIAVIDRLIAKKISKYENNEGCSYSVIEKDGTKVIGNIELKVDEANRVGEISYVFNDKYWNKGFATEAIQEIIRYAFNDLNLDKIVADCIKDNTASNHILQDKVKMKLVKEDLVEQTQNGEIKMVPYLFFELNNTIKES